MPYKFEHQDEFGPNRETCIRIWCKLRREQEAESKITRILLRVENFTYPVYVELPTHIDGQFVVWDDIKAEKVYKAILKCISSGKGSRPDAVPIGFQYSPVSKLYYYLGERRFPCLIVYFRNNEDVRYFRQRTRDGLYMDKWKIPIPGVWGDMVDIVNRFLTIKNLGYTQWIRCHGLLVEDSAKIAKRHPEFIVNVSTMVGVPLEESTTWQTSVRLLGLDIETYSDRHNAFPQKEFERNVIFAASVNFKDMGKPSSQEDNVVIYGESFPIHRGRVHRVNSELELLDRVAELIEHYDPDLIIGHNLFGFDIPYMEHRMVNRHGRKWYNYSNLKNWNIKMINKSWSSSAYSFNNINYWEVPGIIIVDTLPLVRRDYKLPSYSLDVVAKHFIKKGKHPVSAKQMFETYFSLMDTCTWFTNEELLMLRKLTECREMAEPAIQRSRLINLLLQQDQNIANHVEGRLRDFELPRKEENPLNQSLSLPKQIELARKKNRETLIRLGLEVQREDHYWDLIERANHGQTRSFNKDTRSWEWSGKYGECLDLEEDLLKLEKLVRDRKTLQQEHDHCVGQMKAVWAEITEALVVLGYDGGDLQKYFQAVFDTTLVVDYCRVDSVLPIEVFERINAWIGLLELSAINRVGIMDLYTRGQQVRIISQLSDLCWKEHRVIDSRNVPRRPYKGAFVGDAKPGFHRYIVIIDFESLYPSLMIAYNICHTTLVAPEQLKNLKEGTDYQKTAWDEDIEVKRKEKHDLDYEHIFGVKRSSKTTKETIRHHHSYCWMLPSRKEGLLPKMLKDLLARRRAVKKQMDEAKNAGKMAEYNVYFARQNAIKVSCNSAYGTLGAQERGKVSLVEGAATVTYLGRYWIQHSNNFITKTLGYPIIYNDTDSCMVNMHFTDENVARDSKAKINEMLDKVNANFPPPMRLAAEKICSHFLLITPKRYALIDYEPGKKGFRASDIKAKGLIIARRDNCHWMRTLYTDTLMRIFRGTSLQDNISAIYLEFIRLLSRGVHYKDLGIMGQIGAVYKNETYMFNLFSNRLKNSGRPINPGDRVDYLVVEADSRYVGDRLRLTDEYVDSLVLDKPERIDYNYYIENRMLKQLNQLIEAAYKEELDRLDKYYRQCYPDEINKAGRLFHRNRRKLYTRVDKNPVGTFLKIVEERKKLIQSITPESVRVIGPNRGLEKIARTIALLNNLKRYRAPLFNGPFRIQPRLHFAAI